MVPSSEWIVSIFFSRKIQSVELRVRREQILGEGSVDGR